MALTATAEQSNSKRSLIIGIVIALHAVGIYIVESGLSRQIIEMVAPPVETKIIEEEPPKPEEPPPPPPPPDIPVQPPPFIPPPEVTVQVPPQANAIQAVTNEQPPAVVPPVMAPPAPQAPAAVPGTKPKVDGKKSRSPDEYYPAASNRNDETGTAVVRCYVGVDGRCANAEVTTSTGYKGLDEAAIKYATQGLRFIPGTTNGANEAMWYEFKVTFKQKSK